MEYQSVYSAITNYQGYNGFMLSLKRQLMIKGTLSVRQLTCAGQFFGLKTETISETPNSKTFSFNKGDKITIKKWFANQQAKGLKLRIFFRNLIIEEVISETNKAIQVKVSFNSKITTYCHCCGLNLDNEVSKAMGIGPVCAKKYFGFKKVSLTDAMAVLTKIEEEAKIAGVIGPIWIPKSQILSKAEQILFEE